MQELFAEQERATERKLEDTVKELSVYRKSGPPAAGEAS